jgi:hypothetical protein
MHPPPFFLFLSMADASATQSRMLEYMPQEESRSTMSKMSFDLASLLSPCAPEAFFAEFWEQRYLFIKRDQPRYYESLITAADLENII